MANRRGSQMNGNPYPFPRKSYYPAAAPFEVSYTPSYLREPKISRELHTLTHVRNFNDASGPFTGGGVPPEKTTSSSKKGVDKFLVVSSIESAAY
jgi:hypothetical protein